MVSLDDEAEGSLKNTKLGKFVFYGDLQRGLEFLGSESGSGSLSLSPKHNECPVPNKRRLVHQTHLSPLIRVFPS